MTANLIEINSMKEKLDVKNNINSLLLLGFRLRC